MTLKIFILLINENREKSLILLLICRKSLKFDSTIVWELFNLLSLPLIDGKPSVHQHR